METTTHETRTIGSLLRELVDETRQLFKQEVELAKTEAAEKASVAARNVAFLAAGGMVAFAGAIVLFFGLGILVSWALESAGVQDGLAAWLGPVIVGVVVALVGYILVNKGLKAFKDGSLKPEKTIESLREDKQWTQQRLQRA